MSTPGIDVRPIETIEGGSEFCEVFYDGVFVLLSWGSFEYVVSET